MGVSALAMNGDLKAISDETIAELETAKATQELEAPATGTLTRILAPEGETVAVRTVIAEIGEVQA